MESYIDKIPVFLGLKESKQESNGGIRWGRKGPTAVGWFGVSSRVVWTADSAARIR